MGPFLLRRLLTFVATLAVASVVVFAVLELLPGNAAQVILGDSATPESLAAMEAKLGLDRPAFERYAAWVGGWLQGTTAESISYGLPTAELIAQRLEVTLPLALMAMLITVVLALVLGVYAASRHNRLGHVGVMAASQIGIAIPSFWFAILLILLFAVKLPDARSAAGLLPPLLGPRTLVIPFQNGVEAAQLLSEQVAGLDPLQPIVTQCQSGARSAIAASVLLRAGRLDVFNLSGGYVAWRDAGLPVAHAQGVPT